MYTQQLIDQEIPVGDARAIARLIERYDRTGTPANGLDRLLLEQYQPQIQAADLWRNGGIIQTIQIYYQIA